MTKKQEEVEKIHKLFLRIWDEREDEMGYCYCFETNKPLYANPYRTNTCCYDHILEQGKTKFPQYKFLKENIVIVHPDVHTKRHQDIDKCPKIKKYRGELLELHREEKLKQEE